MKAVLKFLSVVLLSLIIFNEASLPIMSFIFSDTNNQFDKIELNELGEAENSSEERADDSNEVMEKFYNQHQPIVGQVPLGQRTHYFVYKKSLIANSHFEVISPPPQI